MRVRHWIVFAATSLMPLTAAAQGADQQKPSSSSCPSEVTKAAMDAIPDSKMTSCRPEGSNFIVMLDTKAGQPSSVMLDASGKVMGIQEPIPVSGLPSQVSKSFKAENKGGKILRAQRVSQPGMPTMYAVQYTDRDGKKQTAIYNEDGSKGMSHDMKGMKGDTQSAPPSDMQQQPSDMQQQPSDMQQPPSGTQQPPSGTQSTPPSGTGGGSPGGG